MSAVIQQIRERVGDGYAMTESEMRALQANVERIANNVDALASEMRARLDDVHEGKLQIALMKAEQEHQGHKINSVFNAVRWVLISVGSVIVVAIANWVLEGGLADVRPIPEKREQSAVD